MSNIMQVIDFLKSNVNCYGYAIGIYSDKNCIRISLSTPKIRKSFSGRNAQDVIREIKTFLLV